MFWFAIPNLTCVDTLWAIKASVGLDLENRDSEKSWRWIQTGPWGTFWTGQMEQHVTPRTEESRCMCLWGWYSFLYCVFASGRPAIEVKKSVSRQASFRCLFSFPFGSEDPPRYTVSGVKAKSPKIQSVKVAVLWNHLTGWVCQPLILQLLCFWARFADIFTQLSGILDSNWSVSLFCQIFLFNGH